MNTAKKIIAILLSALLIGAMFSGCAQQKGETTEITKDTMLIAYTEECRPFLYTDESGAVAGFDADLIKNTFESFKGDYKNYAFVKVEEGYVLNEDICYTDEKGNTYSAVIMCGGMQKNRGTVNKDYNWSSNLIENDIITVVPSGSAITSYSSIANARVGIVSEAADAALSKNAAIKSSLSLINLYSGTEEAFTALGNGEIDAVVIDSFEFYTYKSSASYTVLNGALDTVEYAFAFAPSKDCSAGFNEAVKEMQSAEYGDGDTLTPLVENYFGYKEACVFEYATDGDSN